MKAKLYNLMNWAEIEGIVYSEEDRPEKILGPHPAGSLVLYQAFFPDAAKVSLVIEGRDKKIPMELADEEGFFAATASGKAAGRYHYEVVTTEGKKEKRQDPYAFSIRMEPEQLRQYKEGVLYSSWQQLGSHKVSLQDTEGVSFLIRVPGAVRVSVLGEFNHWDGRVYPMSRVEGSDIFAIFIPGLTGEEEYLYEAKNKDGSTYLLTDPYALSASGERGRVSRVYDQPAFLWQDEKWIDKQRNEAASPFIYSWNGEDSGKKTCFADIKSAGFTHISLPEYELGDSFYEAPACFGAVDNLKEFVNQAHKAGLGVIFNWKAAHCSRLQTKEISNYYISNILFYIEECHLDGVILSGLEELFYLDYKKSPGQWIPNVHGGNENLEGIELIKHMVSIIRIKHSGVMLMASLDALWAGVTEGLSEGGLGFDYRFDTSFTGQIYEYLTRSEWEREQIHHFLTKRLDYAREQNFIMAFEKEAMKDLWNRMEGEEEDKFRLLKVVLAYISFLPGCLLCGFALPDRWEKDSIQLLKKCREMKSLMEAPEAESENVFLFINKEQRKEGTVSFMWTSPDEEGSLLVMANFSGNSKQKFMVGVPFEGRYELVFDTGVKAFGGEQMMLPQILATKEEGWDGFPYRIWLDIEGFCLKVFRYVPFTEKEILEMAAKRAEEIRIQLEQEAKEKIARLKERKNRKAD